MPENRSAPRISPTSSDFVEVLSDSIFKSLPRSDQRRWAQVYLQGLVATPGKKTIRNIAGEWKSPVEQSLQQFISKSPWEWSPVRQELARFLETNVQRSLAWVIRPLVIEKAGSHSVGVARQFVAQLGRVANCQQAVGIWLVSERAGFPVEWSLILPPPWTTESGLRRRARIPESDGPPTPVQAALHSVSQMVGSWPLEVRPVIMDLNDAEPLETISALIAMNVPFILKVKGSLPVALGSDARRHVDLRSVTADYLIKLLRAQRRPVEWNCPLKGERLVAPLVAQDVLIQPAGGDPVQLQLLGAWPPGGGELPTEFWLSNMVRTPSAQVFRLAKLSDRVTRDFDDFCDPIGIRDFSGRSFRGWHHHATLVAAAHAVAVLVKWADNGAEAGLAPPVERPSVQPATGFMHAPSARPQWLASG
ncbi:IS701 family transposase [Streptacidiphilus sp. N1-12]|uniref:IS701 family transposase n=2 Tax=Streptacidiphilus alkalitolerans TaxID=3342712 RepID=A0ABV6WVW9_9ACTN